MKRATHYAHERGAAAVEFALVSLIFFPLLFGMIDYGLWFNDSLNARQGVREGARMAVVKNIPSCTPASTDIDRIKCNTKREVGSLSGPTYIRVNAPEGWAKGKRLVVCAMVKSNGVTGLVPLPGDRIIRTKTQMSIEVVPAPSGGASAEDTPPTGANWSWC